MALLGLRQPSRNQSSTPLATRQPQAPGTNIGYDPLLIKRLQFDHKRMLELYTQTQVLLTTQDFNGVKRKLGELRIILQDHLMMANVKFYIYLSRQLAGDAEKSAIINEYRRDMVSSSREIMDFLRTYSSVRLDDSFANTFQIELLGIGASLVKRIEREQTTLFPMYKSSY
jgi:hypothetical protein